MITLFRSYKHYIAGGLLAVLVLGPFGVGAQSTILAQLTELRGIIEQIQNLINTSPSLTVNERLQYQAAIDAVEDEIVLITALETTGVTMEVVVSSSTYAEAEVITANGVEHLEFYLDSRFASSTQEEIVAEVVTRAARTLNLLPTTLERGVVATSSFSGIIVPEVERVEITTPTAEPTYGIAEAAGRTNIELVRMEGSVPDYDMEVTVVYGPESGFERATITERYTFDRPESEDIIVLIEDIADKSYEQVVQDFGINIDYLRSNAVITIERYRDADDVPEVSAFGAGYNPDDVESVISDMDLLVAYLGTYSVIDEIVVQTSDVSRTGESRGLTISFFSDQDEEVRFAMQPEYSYRGDDGREPTGRILYEMSYLIHNVALEQEHSVGGPDELSLYFELYMAEAADLFAGVDVDLFSSQLTSFLSDNGARFVILARSSEYALWEQSEAAACYGEREKDIVKEVLEYYLTGLQLSDEIEHISHIYPEVYVFTDDERDSFTATKECFGVNSDSYFTGFPEEV